MRRVFWVSVFEERFLPQKLAERRGGPHFADFVRNDVFFVWDFADMGRSSAAPLRSIHL